jgi:hypothetical protein
VLAPPQLGTEMSSSTSAALACGVPSARNSTGRRLISATASSPRGRPPTRDDWKVTRLE